MKPPAYSERDPNNPGKVVPSAPYLEEAVQPLNGASESFNFSQGGTNSSLGYRDSFASPGNNVGFPCYEAGSSYGGAADNASRGYGGPLPGDFAVTSGDSVGVGIVSCPLTSFGYHDDVRKTTSF